MKIILKKITGRLLSQLPFVLILRRYLAWYATGPVLFTNKLLLFLYFLNQNPSFCIVLCKVSLPPLKFISLCNSKRSDCNVRTWFLILLRFYIVWWTPHKSKLSKTILVFSCRVFPGVFSFLQTDFDPSTSFLILQIVVSDFIVAATACFVLSFLLVVSSFCSYWTLI